MNPSPDTRAPDTRAADGRRENRGARCIGSRYPGALQHRLAALALGAVLLLGSALVQAETLTNADVIKLVDAGLADDTISLSIRSAANTRFDTTANGLAALAKAGVSDAVVQTMIQRASAGEQASNPAAQAVSNIRPLTPNKRKVQPPSIQPQIGESYFTRFNLWYEKATHKTTNYTRGTLLPVNTRVTLTSMGPKKMVITPESGESVTIALARKFSLRSLEEIAAELLSPKAIPLARLGKDLERAISQGTMRLGMTREQVLMTRGYPPRHKTPSLDNDQWIYWSSRFVHRTLVFQDGVLARGRGLN